MPLTVVQFEYAWKIHAYLRLAGIYYEEENRDYPISVTERNKAYLIDGPYIVDGDHVVPYLKEKYTDIDLDYSEVERSEISVYSYLLETVGRNLFNKRKWMNWQNVKHMIQTTYQPIIGLPYSLYYAFSQWNTTQKETKAFQKGVELSEEEMVQILEAVYAFINTKLVKQKEPDFIFGYRPSTLDVMCIAHLAMIQECPNSLQHIVDVYPELMKYYERMLTGYFVPLEVKENTQLTTNRFVEKEQLNIELSSKKLCYIERKAPYEEEKKEEESEEERMQKEEEARLEKTKKWRIGIFSTLAILGIGAYMAIEIPDILSSLGDNE